MTILLNLLPTKVQPTICSSSNHFRVFREVEFSDSRKIAKNNSENEIRQREIWWEGIVIREIQEVVFVAVLTFSEAMTHFFQFCV